MNKFETERLWFKIGFVVGAVILPIVLPLLAPCLGIREDAKISLSGTQVVYAVLSCEIALAIYMWGVGNWSRFEPPKISSASSTSQAGDPTQTSPPKPTPPAQQSAGAPGQTPSTPPAPQGGH